MSLHEQGSLQNKARQDEFIGLLEPLRASLSRFCRAMCRESGKVDDERAKDLASDTVLKAYESFDKLRDPQAFQSYLFTIAVRICRHDGWRRRIWLPISKEHRDIIAAPTTGFEEAADVAALHAAISRLPAKQQEAVILSELLGFKLEEVAKIQASSLSAVKSRVSRGRQKLADILGVADHAEPMIEKAPVPVSGPKASSRVNPPFQTQFAYWAKEKL